MRALDRNFASIPAAARTAAVQYALISIGTQYPYPRDPILRLAELRKRARRAGAGPVMAAYGALLQRVASPVNLPRDRKPEPTRAELFADLAAEIRRASQLHASLLPVMAQAERVLGARA